MCLDTLHPTNDCPERGYAYKLFRKYQGYPSLHGAYRLYRYPDELLEGQWITDSRTTTKILSGIGSLYPTRYHLYEMESQTCFIAAYMNNVVVFRVEYDERVAYDRQFLSNVIVARKIRLAPEEETDVPRIS